MNIRARWRWLLFARQRRTLLLHLDSHLHPHVLHVRHIVAVARVIWVVVLLAEFIDVVNIEEGRQAFRFAVDVEEEFLGERVEILQLIFYRILRDQRIAQHVNHQTHRPMSQFPSVSVGKTTEWTRDPASRGHWWRWCHFLVVERRVCGSFALVSLDYRNIANRAVVRAQIDQADEVAA